MPDLDRLRTDELARFGYIVIVEGEAKHRHNNSRRQQCARCGLWFKKLSAKSEGRSCRECHGGAVTSSRR